MFHAAAVEQISNAARLIQQRFPQIPPDVPPDVRRVSRACPSDTAVFKSLYNSSRRLKKIFFPHLLQRELTDL